HARTADSTPHQYTPPPPLHAATITAMASATTAAALLLALLVASGLPTSDAIPPPEQILEFVRDQISAVDVISWAREVAREQREELCGEKGRGRPLNFPFGFRWSWIPIGMKMGATGVEGAMWVLAVLGRTVQSRLCIPKEMMAEGRNCCCCGGFMSRRCCCCCC
ncbi:unnamed protein product, partial [Urochloa humidicola]